MSFVKKSSFEFMKNKYLYKSEEETFKEEFFFFFLGYLNNMSHF
jgi:hypothetical protein